MIYFARIVFLVGTLVLALGICCLVAKLLLEPYFPDAVQGYWVEVFLAIILGTLTAGAGQLLGNDLIGPGKAINDRLDQEHQEFRRADTVTRFWFGHLIFSNVLHFLRHLK